MGRNKFEKKNDWKKIEKYNVKIAHNVLYAKKEKYILIMFQNITQTVKNKLENRDKMALSCSQNTISIIKRNDV